MTLRFAPASFGYHGNVPSLMKYYGKDPRTITRCPVYGTLLALGLWRRLVTGDDGQHSTP